MYVYLDLYFNLELKVVSAVYAAVISKRHFIDVKY